MIRSTLLSLSLALTLSACGGGGSESPRDLLSSANKAMGSGDYATAMAEMEKAAGAIGADDPLYMEVQKGLLRAQAGADPAKAIASLGSMAGELGDSLDVSIYSSVAADMSAAGHFDEAVEVVGLADGRFGKTDLMSKQVANIIEQMKSAGATGALDAMAGLGYVGD